MPQGSKSQAKDKTKCGTRGGKGKKHEQHVHLATVATLPSPTTTTVAAIGPSGIEKRIASVGTDLPATHDPKASLAFFPSTSHARTLAECIGEPPTQHVLKTLEQCISMPLVFPEPVLVAKEGARMTTGIPFPSTSEDDASSLFSIDIDDESPPPSPPSSSSTPCNGSRIGTHCPPSPTAEIGEPILSQSSVDQFWAEIEEQRMIDEARWPMTTPDC